MRGSGYCGIELGLARVIGLLDYAGLGFRVRVRVRGQNSPGEVRDCGNCEGCAYKLGGSAIILMLLH